MAVAAALVVMPVAAAMGLTEYEAATQAADEKASSSHQAVAVLQEDAEGSVLPEGATGFVDPKVPVSAIWRTADGSAHDGEVAVAPELTAGTEVPVWLDSAGELTAAPAERGEIVADSVMSSLGQLVKLELAVLAGYWLALWLIERARQATLGAQWAQIEPKWSRRND